MQAVDKRSYYRDLLQSIPASWSEHQQHSAAVPTTMDFAYDGVYNTSIPNGFNAFPSMLTQTLGELDIDNSIHKLFEGLPEISEEMHSTHRNGDSALGRPTVTGASSPFFPFFTSHAQHGTFKTAQNATPPATFLRPKPVSEHEFPPAPANPNGALALKGKRTGTETARWSASVGAKVLRTSRASPKVLDARMPSMLIPRQPFPHVACTMPKILPSTAKPAVDLRAVAKANEMPHVHPSIGLGPQAVLRIPKLSRKAPPPHMANTRTQQTRYFDNVEHIVRERWRRDDMAGKFMVLESLLPPSTKRDRSTIVEDSMKLVKSLQHRQEEALKRRAELRLAALSPGMKLNRIMQKIGLLAMIPMHEDTLGTMQESLSSSSLDRSATAGTKRPLEACITAPQHDSGQIPQALSDCVNRCYVQSELSTGDVVIEMICEQIPHFHSLLLKSMETLGLEVIRCSITKTINKLICNFTVKPFPYSASVNFPSTSVMEGLSSAFQKA